MSTSNADFCLKKMIIKNNLLSQSIVEDGKNAKNYYVGKIMYALSLFQVKFKKKLSSTQILASEKSPEKYAFSDATVSISLKIL